MIAEPHSVSCILIVTPIMKVQCELQVKEPEPYLDGNSLINHKNRRSNKRKVQCHGWKTFKYARRYQKSMKILG
jgi:hypothetical protein